MKKNVLIAVLLLLSVGCFAQKVTLSWVKTMITNDTNYLGGGIRHPVWYPQISGCRAEKKINKWLKNAAPMWSDYNYTGISDKELYSAYGNVAVTENNGYYLILYLKSGWHNSNRAKEHEYYVRLNLKTGTVQEKTENYSEANWDKSGW